MYPFFFLPFFCFITTRLRLMVCGNVGRYIGSVYMLPTFSKSLKAKARSFLILGSSRCLIHRRKGKKKKKKQVCCRLTYCGAKEVDGRHCTCSGIYFFCCRLYSSIPTFRNEDIALQQDDASALRRPNEFIRNDSALGFRPCLHSL